MSRKTIPVDGAAMDRLADDRFIPIPLARRQLRLTPASMLRALDALGITPHHTATARQLISYNELCRIDQFARTGAS